MTYKLGSLEPTSSAQILTNPHLLSPQCGVCPRVSSRRLPELSLGAVSGVTLDLGFSALAWPGDARAAPLLRRGRAVLGDGLPGERRRAAGRGGGCPSALPGTALPFAMGRGERRVCVCAGGGCPNATATAPGQHLGVRSQPAWLSAAPAASDRAKGPEVKQLHPLTPPKSFPRWRPGQTPAACPGGAKGRRWRGWGEEGLTPWGSDAAVQGGGLGTPLVPWIAGASLRGGPEGAFGGDGGALWLGVPLGLQESLGATGYRYSQVIKSIN